MTSFFKRWMQGIKDLPVSEQLKAKKAGTIGNIIGFVSAFIYLVYQKQYIWLIVIFFTLWITVVDLISLNQQYQAAINMEEQIKNLKEARI